MGLYVLKRLGHAVLVLWAAFTITFLILYLVPGDPVALMLGPEGMRNATPEQLEVLRERFGTDQPVAVQYISQLAGVVTGDFGNSFKSGVPVTTLILNALPSTLALAATSLSLGFGLGALLGVGIAFTRVRALRSLLTAVPPIVIALPSFWVGLMLIQIVSFRLGWLPAVGGSGFDSLVLPTITLAIPIAAVIAQVFSHSLERTLAEPYAQVVVAKGASRSRLFLRHALRNAVLPALTVAGLMVALFIGGSVLVDTVFSRNGLGQLAATAVSNKDVPVVLGVVVVAAAAFVLTSLLVDLVYPLIDPRIRLGAVKA